MSEPAPLVTVCIPSYNYADFLPCCLESALAQTFSDFELLIVDDASTDDSALVAESYRDPRVRVIRHAANVGAVETWNHGLTLARGEYISFLCADDYFLPDKLSEQLDVMMSHPEVALVHADAECADRNGAALATFRSVFPAEIQVHLKSSHIVRAPQELPLLAAGYNYVHLSSALFRRRLALDLGGFAPAFPYAADWDLWLRLAARHAIAYVARPLSAIRRHDRNLTLAMHASGQAFRDWYNVMDRVFGEWPPDAGPLEPVREQARRAVREHLLRQVHRDYARGMSPAVGRDLRLAFRRDPGLRLDALTLATYVKACLGVPYLKRRHWSRPDRDR